MTCEESPSGCSAHHLGEAVYGPIISNKTCRSDMRLGMECMEEVHIFQQVRAVKIQITLIVYDKTNDSNLSPEMYFHM